MNAREPADVSPASGDETALLRIISGAPTDEELAALTVVIAARRAAGSRARGAGRLRRSAWAEPLRLVRAPLHPGPGQWRAQAFPR
jgi:hypothetical protein